MCVSYSRAIGALLLSAGLSCISAASASEAMRLPPVAAEQPLGAPVEVGAAGSGVLWSGSLEKRLTETAESMDSASPAAVQPVAWSALELAQRTVPQGVYAGADYLLLKPRMSEPISFFSGGENNGAIDINANAFNFNYQSSPRVFLGYRNPATGSAVQFTYWHFQDSDGMSNTAPPNSGFIPNLPLFMFLIGNGFESNPGDTIVSQMKMQLNVYDIEFFKPVALGGGRWLMTGSIGARILDYKQSIGTSVTDTNAIPTFLGQNNLKYTGAGPRAGLEARRIIGANGALYARGGYALLVGSRSAQANFQDFSQQGPAFMVNENLTKVISVADFELGGSWRYGNHVTLSAGWMVAAFTDLAGTSGTLNLTDNANILSFDGLVARAAFSW